jgi:hypothetical protein
LAGFQGWRTRRLETYRGWIFVRTCVRDLGGAPYARLRRALDRGNVTEALSAASELEHVGLTEALELCLLLVEKAPERFERAALRWHGRYCREIRDVDFTEAQAILATLAALAGERRGNAAFALADLLSRRPELERACGALVVWAQSQ